MSIVAISDVHLGIKGANESKFIKFLETRNFEEIDNFVLLGDIIDIWRRDFTKVILECSKSLTLLNDLTGDTKIHYVVGNHDYYLLRLSQLHKDNFPFEVEKSTVIKDESTEFYFTHGYQLEVLCNPHYKSMKTYETFSEQLCLAGDDEGNAADAVYKGIQACRSVLDNLKRLPNNPKAALKSMMEPPEERIRNFNRHNVIEPVEKLAGAETRHYLLGIRPEQFLIYGHTHHPYKDIPNSVANTGSWGFVDPMDHKKKYSYIEITGDVPRLKKF